MTPFALAALLGCCLTVAVCFAVHLPSGIKDGSDTATVETSFQDSHRRRQRQHHHRQLHEVIREEWIAREAVHFLRHRIETHPLPSSPSSILMTLSESEQLLHIHQHLDVDFAQRIHAATIRMARSVQREHGHHNVVPSTTTTTTTTPADDGHYFMQPSLYSAISYGFTHRNDRNGSWSSSSSSPTTTRQYLPATTYGADPTGQNDSTLAFQAMVQDILTSCSDGVSCYNMSSGIVDLGGATIDLEGGRYLLSKPVYVPPFFGNINMGNGALRASPNFPNHRWLIEIGNLTECLAAEAKRGDEQKSCHEFINLHHLLLDANHVAAGGIKADGIMGATFGAIFVTHFPHVGIQINGGHEVMVRDSWLAEWYWNDDTPHRGCDHQHSIGIQLNGMDHYLTNVIIFHCTKIGVQITQPANLLVGVHTWNGGGVGIQLGGNETQVASGSTQNRLIACYLDFNSLDIHAPIQMLTVEFGFFLQTGVRLFAGQRGALASKLIDGLILRSNSYVIWNHQPPIQAIGNFTSATVKNVQIMDDFNANKATKVTKSLERHNAASWLLDFGDELLFPFIGRVVSYTVVPSSDAQEQNFFQHMILPPKGTLVEVVTSKPVDATVYVTVEQGQG